MPVRPYEEIHRHERLQEMDGKAVRFFVPWSDQERTGTISRVGFDTVWVGAFVYSHHHLLGLREVH